MMRTEQEVLADLLNYNRKSTLGYLSKIKEFDLTKTFSAEGKELNSPIWILGHLATTQNYLCLKSTGAEMVRFSWAKLFGMGSVIPDAASLPPVEEIVNVLNEVHQRSLTRILSLSNEDLALPTTTGFAMGGEDSYRAIIRHAIMHEGIHAGHMGWICKLWGVKTI